MIKSHNQILNELNNLSDAKYKDFHQSLSPEIDKIIGIRIPVLKEYAKNFLKDEQWQQSYKNIGTTYNEEIILRGIVIGISKISAEEKIGYLSNFVPLINSWSSCDTSCATFKFTRKNEEIMWNFLERYYKSKKEFEVRFAVVMYLDYFINNDYVDLVIERLSQIKQTDYYVKMAIAWAISVIIVKYPQKGLKYLEEEKQSMESFIFNKAIQKSIESYRISMENKDKLRKLKEEGKRYGVE